MGFLSSLPCCKLVVEVDLRVVVGLLEGLATPAAVDPGLWLECVTVS